MCRAGGRRGWAVGASGAAEKGSRGLGSSKQVVKGSDGSGSRGQRQRQPMQRWGVHLFGNAQQGGGRLCS